jgi:hypothetical protein
MSPLADCKLGSANCKTFLLAAIFLTATCFAADDPAVIRSVHSGPWSAAATWEGGQVPGAGSRVMVAGGHTVTYDVQSDAVIRAINVSGTLAFARDRHTLLNCGLIKIEANDAFSENGFDCEGHFDEVDPNLPRATLHLNQDTAHLGTLLTQWDAILRELRSAA